MRIAVGSDHRGTNMLAQIVEILRHRGEEVQEVEVNPVDGTIDYPDVGAQVAAKVSKGEADRGILVCGTGIGMSIIANKFPGIRAAVCYDELTAEISRRHNNLNVLCLSGDMLGQHALEGILNIWLDTPFDGGRHQRRIDKIAMYGEKAARGEF